MNLELIVLISDQSLSLLVSCLISPIRDAIKSQLHKKTVKGTVSNAFDHM